MIIMQNFSYSHEQPKESARQTYQCDFIYVGANDITLVGMGALKVSAFILLIAFIFSWRGKTFAAESENTADVRYTITDFKSSSLFYFINSWKDKIKFVDGHAQLNGVEPSGGMGIGRHYDLNAYTNLTPAIILRTTPANTAKLILLTLGDAEGRSATWFFSLPKPSSSFAPVFPPRAAKISNPNWIEKFNGTLQTNVGPLDLSKIISLKVQGNWRNGVFDLDLDSIALINTTEHELN